MTREEKKIQESRELILELMRRNGMKPKTVIIKRENTIVHINK